MSRTLTDEDIDRIAERVLELVAERLVSRPPATPAPPPVPPTVHQKDPAPKPSKLGYSVGELSAEIGVSKVTIYRLIDRGLLRPLPYIRTKIFSHQEVARFLAEGDARMRPFRGKVRR